MCPTCSADRGRILRVVSLGEHADDVVLTVAVTTRPPDPCAAVDAAESERPVMEFIGDIDSFSSSAVEPSCHEWVSTAGDAAVDLSAVTFVDAAGSRFLERLRDDAPGSVELRNPSRIVKRLFEVVGRPIEPDPPRRVGPPDRRN